MSARFAVCYVPDPESRLYATASSWLGRDIMADAAPAERLVLPALTPEETESLTASPRRMGLAGVLKPPFALSPDKSEAELLERLEAFAAENISAMGEPLVLTRLDDRVSLLPVRASNAVKALAAGCVRVLDAFRDKSVPTELPEGTDEASITERQQALAQRWGSHFVIDYYRFHMPLTGVVADKALLLRVHDALTPTFRSLVGGQLNVDRLCLLKADAPDADYRALGCFELVKAE